MTEQKECKNCAFWCQVVKGGFGPIPAGGDFRKPDQKGGRCEKQEAYKSAHDTCDDWEPKNSQ